MNVFFNVTCWSEENAFGATLFLKTVRVGFPSANLLISVNQNFPVPASVWEALKSFVAKDKDCCVMSLQEWTGAARDEEHGPFIRSVIEKSAMQGIGDLMFSDTDVVFWDSMETLTLPAGKLYGGRFIPEIVEFETRMAPRPHPSMFFVPDPTALLSEINACRGHIGHVHPFEGFTFIDDEERRMFDVLASLYALLPERMYGFTEAELDRYDHLFCGTYMDLVGKMGKPPGGGIVHEAHALARRDLSLLKGFWRRQEACYRSSLSNVVPMQPASGAGGGQ